jgi:hypothetical protein
MPYTTISLFHRLCLPGVYVALSLAPGFAAGQSQPSPPAVAAAWNPPRTPDGQPDVQGFWASVTNGLFSQPADGEYGNPPGHKPRKPEPRRVVDPPDHEVPYQHWARIKQQYIATNINFPTREEFVDPQVRCLPDGPVRDAFFHDFQIMQYPGYVVIEYEGDHDFRVIPLDGRPHPGSKIKLWMGDSRGHWEGTTLVVDVTNNNSKGRLSRYGDFASDNLHLTERFIFIDAKTLKYDVTFVDPTVYTQPWRISADFVSGIFPNGLPHSTPGITMDTPRGYEQWEEACHEGERNADDSLQIGNPGSSGTIK